MTSRSARNDPVRVAGFIACLVGALAMISGRYATWAPVWLVYVGLSTIVFGWGLFALSVFRRVSQARLKAKN